MNRSHCLLASIALAAGPAVAADSGFYVGAGVGTGSFSVSEKKAENTFQNGFANYNLDLDTTSSKVSDNATIWSGLVGYRLNDWLAFELAYLDLSGAEYDASGTARFGTSTAVVPVKLNAQWDANGWPLTLLGIWPINDTWEVFGRMGVFIGDVKLDYSVQNTVTGDKANESNSQSSTQFIGGVGVDANFYDHWTARFEWVAMPSIGNDETGSANWNALQLGLLYRF